MREFQGTGTRQKNELHRCLGDSEQTCEEAQKPLDAVSQSAAATQHIGSVQGVCSEDVERSLKLLMVAQFRRRDLNAQPTEPSRASSCSYAPFEVEEKLSSGTVEPFSWARPRATEGLHHAVGLWGECSGCRTSGLTPCRLPLRVPPTLGTLTGSSASRFSGEMAYRKKRTAF